MKVFKKEKEKKCVKVTVDSIAILCYIDDNMPESILLKVKEECPEIHEDDMHKYVYFFDKKEIEYFKKINWIYDFDKYLQMSEIELKFMSKGISEILEIIREKRKKDKSNLALKAEFIKKQYELISIETILNIKSNMPEPEHISPDKICFLQKDDNLQITREGAVYKYPKLGSIK